MFSNSKEAQFKAKPTLFPLSWPCCWCERRYILEPRTAVVCVSRIPRSYLHEQLRLLMNDPVPL